MLSGKFRILEYSIILVLKYSNTRGSPTPKEWTEVFAVIANWRFDDVDVSRTLFELDHLTCHYNTGVQCSTGVQLVPMSNWIILPVLIIQVCSAVRRRRRPWCVSTNTTSAATPSSSSWWPRSNKPAIRFTSSRHLHVSFADVLKHYVRQGGHDLPGVCQFH